MSDFQKLLALPKRIGSVRWLKKYIKPFGSRILLLSLFASAGAVLTIIGPVLYSRVIAAANSEIQGTLSFFIIAYVGSLLLGLLLNVATSIFTVTITERCSYAVRKDFFIKILDSDWLQSSRLHSGDYLSRLTSDVNAVSNGILSMVPSVIALLVQLATAFSFLINKNAMLAVVVIILAPFAALVSRVVGRRLKLIQKKVMESEAAYRSFMQETMVNLTVVKAFHYKDNSLHKLDALQNDRMKWILKRNRLNVISSLALSLGYMSVSLFGFIYGAVQISKGNITTADLILIVTLISKVQAPIMGFASMIPQMINIVASAERLIDVEEIPREKKGTSLPATQSLFVRADNITYAYAGSPVIQNSSFVIRPGEIVAMAGASGMGKTTIVRMLLALIQPQSGRMDYIADNGQAVQVNPAVRKHIAYVPQGNTLLSGTIKDNLRLGKPDASEKDMWDALTMACAADFVCEQPQGLETTVGERGVGLSEGQAQRIAIARALIRQSPLLLLDEATSSLDEKTEADILQALKKNNRHTACVIITHRISTLSICDRFIKIDNKKVVETSFQDLQYSKNSPS